MLGCYREDRANRLPVLDFDLDFDLTRRSNGVRIGGAVGFRFFSLGKPRASFETEATVRPKNKHFSRPHAEMRVGCTLAAREMIL